MYRRRILTTLVLASHAAVSLCGPGHHALGGLGEGFAAMESSAAQASVSPEIAAHDKDRPAWHYFSLAALLNPFAPAMIRSMVEPAPDRIDRIRLVKPFPVASPPRAPPCATA